MFGRSVLTIPTMAGGGPARGWVGAVVVPIRNGTNGIEVLLGQNPVVDLVKSTSFEPGADGEEGMPHAEYTLIAMLRRCLQSPFAPTRALGNHYHLCVAYHIHQFKNRV